MTTIYDDLIYEPNIVDRAIEVSENSGYCVYFLIRENRIVYIGQSKEFEKRINRHICDSSKSFDSYFVRNCSADEVDSLESFLIMHHQPEYNMIKNENSKRKFHTPVKAAELLNRVLNHK